MGITLAAAAALAGHEFLPVFHHVGEKLACFGVFYNGPYRELYDKVKPVPSGAKASHASLTRFGLILFFVTEVQQACHAAFDDEHDVTAASAVAAVRAALWHIFLAPE